MARLPYVQGAHLLVVAIAAIVVPKAAAQAPARGAAISPNATAAPTVTAVKKPPTDGTTMDGRAMNGSATNGSATNGQVQAAKEAGAKDEGARKSAPAAPEQWPKMLPDTKAQAKPAQAWSEAEVAAAREQCKTLLAGIHAVATPAPPMRDGECGAPAPIELTSIGSNPPVTLSGSSIVTCEFAAALEKWLRTEVQPAAKELLGSPVNRLEVMSAYSCRNAYGRKKSRLSEHGRANALDVKLFSTERGGIVDVATEWGPTERDIKARIAAAAAAEAKAEATKREAERISAEQAAKAKGQMQATAPSGRPEPSAAAPALRGSIAEQSPPLELRYGSKAWREVPGFGLQQPSRLGGPKSAAAGERAEPGTAKARFLRRVHAGGCRTFMTILGPEANEAHRNHFHVDMAERQSGRFCE